jgi:hypothetical protein
LSDDATIARHPGWQIRFAENQRGQLLLRGDNDIISSRRIRAQRERRVLLPMPSRDRLANCASLALEFLPD